MNRLYRAFGLLFFCLFFYQCQKDLSYIGGPDSGIPVIVTPDPIKANLQGNVLDENNQPAAGVSITVGAATAITNASGYFRITNAALDKNTSLVIAQKTGYFKGYRVFAATSGTNQVVIKLIKKNLAGTIAASSGGSATLTNGAKISLPADGVVMASSNAAYSGDVKVYAAYIDPASGDIGETVPGSFAANDKNGNRVALSSFGMLAVELESSAGEKLQIKPGATATLTTPIPSSTLSRAPATVAMWFVDEQTGIWKEEGKATKQGNNYVGDVKHFSFWNCDYPFNAVSLSVTLHTPEGLPLVYAAVRLTATPNATDTGGSSFAYGYTDSLGEVKGAVPSNKNILLEVIDQCGSIVYSQNISALNQDKELGTITVSNSNALLTFTGTILDCSGIPVKKGFVIINVDNLVINAATDANGKFATTIVSCSTTIGNINFVAVDETGQQQSSATTITGTTPITDMGSISACGTSVDQYVNFTLDGADYSITSTANDSLSGYMFNNNTYITASKAALGGDNLSFTVSNISTTGTFSVDQFSTQNFLNTVLIAPFNVTFTKYANIGGEFYEGSFSGKFTDSTSSAIHNISSTFRLRRTF